MKRLFHNDTTCHNLTTTDRTPNTTSNDHSDFLSTTTFAVLSVLLASGSLIVGILALLQYRRRKRLALHASPSSTPIPLSTLYDFPATTPICLTSTYVAQRPPNPMSTRTSEDVQIFATSTSSTLVLDAMPVLSPVQKEHPARPLLSQVRKRSSCFQSQRVKISYRTSTY
ncbi:hypothetical protein K491DRAFT_142527 [Lophiostoma macrostomum CBS 122681]|uniref:Uncharacterized protein n=1 Tax=Lophiostoma macrostomum CBS 122681 TaxID=1314788 RepID=A0A6A6ST88_9PLEO|nr:hypothetical protein K491DRAFT_142527 [Lophiostoma macrostomum CBS 122681]